MLYDAVKVDLKTLKYYHYIIWYVTHKVWGRSHVRSIKHLNLVSSFTYF